MLPLEEFHGERHEERMEAARRRIPLLTEDWNNLQEYDPGMTLVELLSWLTAVQRKSMEEISADSENRLCSLLGVPALHARGARALLEIGPTERPVRLPRGVKWRAGELVFENDSPLLVTRTRLTALRGRGGEDFRPDGAEGRAFPLFGEAPGQGDWFELVFDPPLPDGEAVSLAFDCPPPAGRVRNPVPEDGDFCPLAQIEWRAWGAEGWGAAEMERDDTRGFLFSGLLRLRTAVRGAARLRCVLAGGGYDFPPRAASAAYPALEVEQRDTICRFETVTAGALRAGRGTLNSAEALYGETQCYRRSGKFWRPCAALLTPDGLGGIVRVDAPWDAALGEGEPELLAVSFDGRRPGPADGAGRSGQTLALPEKGVEHEGFAVLVGEGEAFSFWEQTADFYGCGAGDRVCRLEGGRVCFGDGEYGMAPPRGTGNIRVAALALTRGAASNLRPGRIGPPEDGPYAGLRARQLTAAAGGRDEETRGHRRARCAALFTALDRAVTAGDYEALARSAPGLLIEDARVLPNRAFADGKAEPRPGTVTVLVRGAGGDGAAEGYVENIRRRLERRRLAGTRVEVCWRKEERT